MMFCVKRGRLFGATAIFCIIKKMTVTLLISLVFAGILFVAYYEVRGRLSGRVANARIEMDTSVIFSVEEIESAIYEAIRDFANSNDSWNELLEIRYDEWSSHMYARRRELNPTCVIVLHANYQRSGVGKPPIMRSWSWVLIRDGTDGTWNVIRGGKTYF